MASVGNPQTQQGHAVSSVTVSNYTPPSGDDKIVSVSVYAEYYTAPASLTSVTYGGTAMTERRVELSSRNGIYVYDVQIGSSTTPSDIVVTADPSLNLHVGAVTLIGVAQQAPEASVSSITDYDSTGITTLTNDALIIDFASNGAAGTVTPPDAGQTALYTEDDTTGDLMAFSSSYKMAGSAGLQTMGWSSGGTRPIHLVLAYEVVASGTSLVAADAVHTQSAAVGSFTQSHALGPASLVQGHSAGAASLVQDHSVQVSGGEHAHSAEAVVLSSGTQVVAAGASHQQTCGAADFQQDHILTVTDPASVHLAAAATFFTQSEIIVSPSLHAVVSTGGGFGSGALAPGERMIRPEAHTRFTRAVSDTRMIRGER